jgi:UDP-N-acetylglucosamine 1-carboxyvinyltransferase
MPTGFTGADILLDEPSVTGTANLVMAAVMAEGETTNLQRSL